MHRLAPLLALTGFGCTTMRADADIEDTPDPPEDTVGSDGTDTLDDVPTDTDSCEGRAPQHEQVPFDQAPASLQESAPSVAGTRTATGTWLGTDEVPVSVTLGLTGTAERLFFSGALAHCPDTWHATAVYAASVNGVELGTANIWLADGQTSQTFRFRLEDLTAAGLTPPADVGIPVLTGTWAADGTVTGQVEAFRMDTGQGSQVLLSF
jgi:hypothetical protein